MAGGFVPKAFWEYAPVGRPHLYPPLLHFIMLIFYKLGLDPISIARLTELIMYPLVLITIWQVFKSVFYPRLGFFAVLVAISSYPFYLSIVDFQAASLALILGMLAFLCIEKRKTLAASILMSLTFYTHASTSIYLILSIMLYGLLNRQRLRIILVMSVVSIGLSLPQFIYQYNLKNFIVFEGVFENFPLEINILVYLLALIGLVISLRPFRDSSLPGLRRDKKYLFFLSLSILTTAFLIYKYRFLCGQGSLGFIFLAAVCVDALYDKLTQKVSGGVISKSFFYTIFLISIMFFILFAPTISIHKGVAKANFLNSTYLNLVPDIVSAYRANELSIYFPRLFKDAADIIKKQTKDNDIIYCNEPYIGGLLFILTGRATSTAMLSEVKPFREFDPISSARIICWFRKPDIYYNKQPESIIKRYNLRMISQTEVLYIYKNPITLAKMQPVKAVLPNGIIYSILTIMVGMIVYDLRNPKSGFKG